MATSIAEQIQNTVARFLVGLPDPVVGLLAGKPDTREGQTLDPQLQLMLRLLGVAGVPRPERMAPERSREFFRSNASLLAHGLPRLERILDRNVPGPRGDIPVRIYVPRTGKSPHPVVVYYHGGGWVVGDIQTHHAVTAALADRAGCIVVSVDYRCAPEHRFPAAAEDAIAAFGWVAANAASFGGDPSRLAVGGDSAGGNLSAVVAQQTRIAGTRMPDFQLLLYPVTDLSRSFPSHEMFAEGYYLTLPLMRWFADHYLGDAGKARDPMASPLLQADLSGLPPAFLATAGWDVLRDEGRAYAERLLEAGVAVEYRNYDRLIHGYFSMGGVVREASRAFDDAVAALRGGLGVD